MNKYINADELIFTLTKTIEKHKDSEMFTRTVRAAENMITIIKRMPSADVVEVVRCKDCKYYHKVHCAMNDGYQDWANDDDFCSYGERKETE